MNEKRQTYIIDGDEKIIVAENLSRAIDKTAKSKGLTRTAYINSIIPEDSSWSRKTVENWCKGTQPYKSNIQDFIKFIEKLDCGEGEILVSVGQLREKEEYEFCCVCKCKNERRRDIS